MEIRRKVVIAIGIIWLSAASHAFGNEGQWTSNGVPICTQTNSQERPAACTASSGGAIIVWQDYRFGNYDIYAQRIDSNGSIIWTWAKDGLVVCNQPESESAPEIVATASGGAIIVWQTGGDIYAQKIDGAGVPLWSGTEDRVIVCNEVNNQANPDILEDGSGGAVIVWEDGRISDSNIDIYAQKLDSKGAKVWTWAENGVIVCDRFRNQEKPAICPDGSGGVIIVWEDKREGGANNDLYAQRMDSNGG
ncbi:hypothetical protein KAR10_09180, partial [bacterium]|nr:hypothetical protein [bacterium]